MSSVFSIGKILKAHSHSKLDWMHIWTSSIRLLQTHKCNVVFVTWPLHQRCVAITVQIVPAKMVILLKSFDFVSLRWVDPGHSRDLIRSQQPWFGHSSSQPSLSLWIFVCARECLLIYRCAKPQITCISCDCRCESTPNWIKTTSWSGLEANRFESRFGSIHFWCERNEFALSVQCKRALVDNTLLQLYLRDPLVLICWDQQTHLHHSIPHCEWGVVLMKGMAIVRPIQRGKLLPWGIGLPWGQFEGMS